MDHDKLQALTHVHRNFVDAAALPEYVRPYNIQFILTEIEKLIMEEIKRNTTDTAKSNDDIPF